MIQIDNVNVKGFEDAIRGMRNPMQSHELEDNFGPNDVKLIKSLITAGPEHAKFRRMITVWCDILAPLYWWKEFETYKVGVTSNSESTMHKIHSRVFDRGLFSTEHMLPLTLKRLDDITYTLNLYRELYLKEENEELRKEYWWQMIQLLPSSWNQKRTISMNYEVLANQYRQRKHHKLDEWRQYAGWIECLPLSWIITGKGDDNLEI